MIREVQFQPGYDYRAEDAEKPSGQRRGVHGLNIRFVYGDPAEGVVQFLVYTDWLPTWVEDGPWGKRFQRPEEPEVQSRIGHLYPMAVDLGYHWVTPRYDEQMRMDTCDLLEQGHCYYDGSGLDAERILATLVTGGHDGVWRELEDYYQSLRQREDA